jgi:hypothetical protein
MLMRFGAAILAFATAGIALAQRIESVSPGQGPIAGGITAATGRNWLRQ